MKQNRITSCALFMCMTIAVITSAGISGVKAQDAGSITRFDRGSDLPTLQFSGTGEIFSQVFRFECTDSITLKIMSVFLVDPESNFSIEQSCDCGELPMTLEPGGLMGIRVTLHTKDQNVHYNQIRFVLSDGSTPVIFNIEAQRVLTEAGVQTTIDPNVFSFSTAPNPSSGSISINVSGADKADVDIFDALGKSVTSQKNVTSWKWEGLSANGTPVPSGNYFIRATTHNASGNIVISTKNVTIAR